MVFLRILLKSNCIILILISVTRALTRALKIIGITLPITHVPLRIKSRRATTTCVASNKPIHQTVKRRLTVDDKATSILSPLLWCVCRRSSFGNMIFCENQNCQIKWFHMKCLKMRKVPIGDWYCRNCVLLFHH